MKLAIALLIIIVAIVGVSMFPVGHTENAPFASPAFQRAWGTEGAAATRVIDLWGSEPLLWRVERYRGAPNDRRTVQYFERGRMEIQAGSSEVTLGLLTREMTTGQISLGEGVALDRQPPDLPIDSGQFNENVPTYLTLSRLVDTPADNRSGNGQRLVDWVNRGGTYQRDVTPAVVRYGEYIEETGHNIPDITASLFERSEFTGGKWINAFGYPLSEPYWTYYRRGDDLVPSVIQVFERRILVYSPTLEPERRFTVANSGRHYFMWRYGTDPTQSLNGTEEAEIPDADLTLSNGYEAYVYASEIGTPIDLELSATGHLMVLTAEGQILKSDSLDPDGPPQGFSVWADGIDRPIGMAAQGASVLVTTAGGSQWFQERNGVGVLDDSGEIRQGTNPELDFPTDPVVSASGEMYGVVDNGGEGAMLREFNSEDPVAELGQLMDEPGLIQFSGNNMFLAGQDDDGRARVFALPASGDAPANGALTELVTFPQGTTPSALAVADEAVWPLSELGTIFVAVQDPEGSRIFALALDRPVESSDAIELASGFARPSSMLFGLDGSLYVADSERGTIIRIHPATED